MVHIGSRLRILIEKKELSNVEFADLIGVSRGTVQRWLTLEDPNISVDNLKKIAQILGFPSPVELMSADINGPISLTVSEKTQDEIGAYRNDPQLLERINELKEMVLLLKEQNEALKEKLAKKKAQAS